QGKGFGEATPQRLDEEAAVNDRSRAFPGSADGEARKPRLRGEAARFLSHTDPVTTSERRTPIAPLPQPGAGAGGGRTRQTPTVRGGGGAQPPRGGVGGSPQDHYSRPRVLPQEGRRGPP